MTDSDDELQYMGECTNCGQPIMRSKELVGRVPADHPAQLCTQCMTNMLRRAAGQSEDAPPSESS